MDDDFRQNVFMQLQEIEKLQERVNASSGQPQEGEVTSALNTLVAFKMSKFGEAVDDVSALVTETSDNLNFHRELKKIGLMKLVDPDTDKNYTSTKAESKVELEEDIRGRLADLRKLQHSEAVLKSKSKSIWEWLNNSRSRLSWLGKEVIHGS